MITEQNEQVFRFNHLFFQKKAQKNFQETILSFKKILRSFLIFNFIFISVIFCQIVSFAILFSFLTSSLTLSVILASFFLTVFSYFILFFYIQGKKTDQLMVLKERFLENCRRALNLPQGAAEHHLSVALAALKLKETISESFNKENKRFFHSYLFKIILAVHKDDLFIFQEKLLISSIEEHIKQLRFTPTDLEVHASLANAYTILTALYASAKDSFFSKLKKSELAKKHLAALKSTIEEYKILNDYAPNDPWIHLQLADSYKKINLKHSELKEYETAYKLCPNDNNILYKLGVLYFEMGKNSKGLRIYEELKSRNYQNSEKLLSYYGLIKSQEFLEDTL